MPETKIQPHDLENAGLREIFDEIAEAASGYESLNEHIESITGGGGAGGGSIIGNAVNIAKLNFKLNAHLAAKKERLANLIVDVFEDQSGIDLSKSEIPFYDSNLKEYQSGLVWLQRTLTTNPWIIRFSDMVYDSTRGVHVLFGGRNRYDDPTNQTWEYDGNDWVRVMTSVSPPAQTDHAMAYSTSSGRIVMLGQYSSNMETWEYNGSNWQKKSPSNMPSYRGGHAMAYDTARNRVVLFGGGYYPSGYPDFEDDTWEYTGSNWVQINTPTKPLRRTHHALAYDSSRGKVVLFGGYFASGIYTHYELNDTWEYDGQNWTQITTEHTPSARQGHEMVYDSHRQKVILFGGRDTSGSLADTWEYDGTDWKEIPTTTSPPPRQDHAMTYDVNRERVVLTSGVYPQDTWELLNISGGTIISTPDELDSIPSQVYIVGNIPPGVDPSLISFEMSLDDGQTWFPVVPETMVKVPASATPASDCILRAKAIMQGGARLSGWAYGWI